jgi:RES domain-containing protein
MLIVWRLTTARFARSAFSGDGARLYGGRWHRKGVPLVYTTSSQSLAMLGMLVQDEPAIELDMGATAACAALT